MAVQPVLLSKWYFGGLASAGAASITHPLDLLKVQMQTQKGKGDSLFKVTAHILKKQGNIFKTSAHYVPSYYIQVNSMVINKLYYNDHINK